MALIPKPAAEQYGGVAVTDDGWVSGFTRAVGAGTASTSSSFHFIGVQVARAKAFVDLADGAPAESVNALYPKLIAATREASPHTSPRRLFSTSARPATASTHRSGWHMTKARALLDRIRASIRPPFSFARCCGMM
jgi:hypothetical protein